MEGSTACESPGIAARSPGADSAVSPLPLLAGGLTLLGSAEPRLSAFRSPGLLVGVGGGQAARSDGPVKREPAADRPGAGVHSAGAPLPSPPVHGGGGGGPHHHHHHHAASGFRVYSKLVDSAAATAASLRYGDLASMTGLNCSRSPTVPFGSTNSIFSRRRRKETRQRRQRTTFTSDQTLKLEMEYHRTEYITRMRRVELAELLTLTETQIKIWFQNRRAKDKRIEKAQLDHQYRSMGLPAPGCTYAATYQGLCGACYYNPATSSLTPSPAAIGRPYHQLGL